MKVFEVNKVVVAALVIMVLSSCMSKPKAKHVFILSGQSNMARLDLKATFIPTIEAKFGKMNVIVVKDAAGGQPIRRWHKNSKSLEGNGPKAKADLYDSLMIKVNAAIANEKINTVTFIWMQGERDASTAETSQAYQINLHNFIQATRTRLNAPELPFVIGRIQAPQKKFRDLVRQAQQEVVATNTHISLVDTDDLTLMDIIHYDAASLVILGRRFAQATANLLPKELKSASEIDRLEK